MININAITKEYIMGDNKLLALNEVDVSIKEGEFVSIMGSSGSGKSTLMNIIGCLDVPTSGDYFFRNKNISNYNSNMLAELRNKDIGFIFQNFNLLPRLNALENVTLPLLYSGKNVKERTKLSMEALENVGLKDRTLHKPNQLSGGQQQRVSIARAIAGNPKLILADEPTGALDSKTSLEIMKILNDLNSNGITIILVTHEKDIAQYQVYMSNVKDFIPSALDSIGSTKDTTYSVSGLVNKQEYFFRVAAKDSSGYLGDYSEQLSAIPEYSGPTWWIGVGGDDTNDGDQFSPLLSFFCNFHIFLPRIEAWLKCMSSDKNCILNFIIDRID